MVDASLCIVDRAPRDVGERKLGQRVLRAVRPPEVVDVPGERRLSATERSEDVLRPTKLERKLLDAVMPAGKPVCVLSARHPGQVLTENGYSAWVERGSGKAERQ